MKVSTVLASGILVLGVLVAAAAHALTLADIQLLRTLGILTDEQVRLAEQAIQASGGAGASIRPDEFSTTECLVFNEDMIRGVSGSGVLALQRFLTSQGHYTESVPSGIYDNQTFIAVADFQIAQGLVASRTVPGAGNVGPITREKIQEISCAAPAVPSDATSAEIVATSTADTDRFTRRPRGTSEPQTRVEPTDGHVMSFMPRLLEVDTAAATYEYKFEVGIVPNDEIATWRFTLTCTDGKVTTNRDDLECGDSLVRRASLEGMSTIRIIFTNTTKYNEDIGFVAVALGKDDIELARATYTATLLPRELQQTSIGGVATAVTAGGGVGTIPEARYCTPSEQGLFIKYIMTRPDPDARPPIAPPPCYPGEVVCTYDYPIGFCEVKGTTINSVSICGGKQYFYDGACRIPDWGR